MKNHWIIIRIVLALVAIFALGIWVGRVTAPEMNAPPFELSIEQDDSADEMALKQAFVRVMARYRAELELTNEQVRILRPEFVVVSRRMQVLPKVSKARLAVLEDFHEELRKHLSEEQKEKLDGITETAESRTRTE